ncbi:Protein of unknown function [Streptomyces atratus]|uniref:YhcG PDDEXK nuclease domain-containing protein n=2 Tax=Streptomyces atratus TaxID=1893 RepID=A0A1K2EN87_STRAR|nr:Protein of unknown function [Streptomyces atratus]
MYGASLYAMDNEAESKAVVPAQRASELPPGFREMIDDLKSIVRGAHVSVVDDLVRDKEFDGPPIGILIAESRDRSTVEYALRGYSRPLAVSTYAGLPDRVRELLPSAEDLSRIADGVLNTPQTTA